jgi:hypothetical protein
MSWPITGGAAVRAAPPARAVPPRSPAPSPRHHQSRTVTDRSAGTVRVNGPSGRASTCRRASSGTRSSIGSSRPSRPSSTSSSAATAVTGLVIDEIERSSPDSPAPRTRDRGDPRSARAPARPEPPPTPDRATRSRRRTRAWHRQAGEADHRPESALRHHTTSDLRGRQTVIGPSRQDHEDQSSPRPSTA